MNQTDIIKYFAGKDIQVFNRVTDYYIHPQGLLDKGIYCCYSCGHLQPLEVTQCKKCGLDKFVMKELPVAERGINIIHVDDIQITPVIKKKKRSKKSRFQPDGLMLAQIYSWLEQGYTQGFVAKKVNITPIMMSNFVRQEFPEFSRSKKIKS